MIKRKLGIIAVLCVLICAALSVLFLDNVERYKFKQEAIYFVNGMDYGISEGSNAVIDDEGYAIITLKNKQVLDRNTIPAYFVGEDKILLLSKLAYYCPSYDAMFSASKLLPFTQISFNDDSLYSNISRNSKSKSEQTGFLFDGYETFVFLEPMKIKYDDKTINVSPLSFMMVNYGNWVQIYNQETNEYTYDDTSDYVVATNSDSSYSINVATRTITFNGKDTLLISNIDMMKDYFR